MERWEIKQTILNVSGGEDVAEANKQEPLVGEAAIGERSLSTKPRPSRRAHASRGPGLFWKAGQAGPLPFSVSKTYPIPVWGINVLQSQSLLA